jgi:hypothetical protein
MATVATDPTPQEAPAEDSATVAVPVEPTTILLVPHTHWDREWYEPFEGFLARLVEMMDGLIELMDREPRFAHFHLDGQAAMIEDYLAVRPERLPDIERLAATGRISVGPWSTQMDEFLVSGESIIRNLEWGLARAKRFGYQSMPVGYLPDQFGHIGQMPQILRRSGIERAVVWRGVPMAVDTTAFWWESPDGSRVLTEYLAFGYSVGWWLAQSKDAEELARYLGQALEWLQPYATRETLLVTVGGDHHVPAAKLPPLLEEVNASPDSPVQARMASLDDYLGTAEPVEGLPEWRGELRSSARAHLLPNVYSARINQKQRRAGVESKLERHAEPLAALVPGFEWPADELEEAWRLVLWNGAHDSVCGCSVDRVAADVDDRCGRADDLARGVWSRALEALVSRMQVAGPVWFNPSPFERQGIPPLGWSMTAPGSMEERVPFEVRDGRLWAGRFSFRLVDEADIGDLYTFCPSDDGPAAEPNEIEVGKDGSVIASFDGVGVRLHAARQPGEEPLRISGVIDNSKPDHRLRLHVGLLEPASGTVALSPFEVVRRPLRAEGGTETPSPTWPASGAVIAGAVAALSDFVFEYEVHPAGELALTLLRCVGTISRSEIATRAWAAGPDIATPDAQMLGETGFSFTFAAAPAPEDLPRLRERSVLLMLRMDAPGGGDLPPGGTLLDVEGDVELSSVRRVDGRIEVRVWNASDRPRNAVVAGQHVELGPAEIRTLRVAEEHLPLR